MRFRSKMDWWFHLVAWFSLAVSIWGLVISIQSNVMSALIVGWAVWLATVLLVVPIYFFTYYTLEEAALYIRCGLCIHKRIAYNDIKLILETRDPSASAGLSLDRISVIHYKKNGDTDEVLISPKDKQEFMRLLAQRMVPVES